VEWEKKKKGGRRKIGEILKCIWDLPKRNSEKWLLAC
jgi:hypothetical protein